MKDNLQQILSPSEQMGQFRLSIIGGLLASPPSHGALNQALQCLADKTWRHPVRGLDVNYSAATLERWYYKAKNSPQNLMGHLVVKKRSDSGVVKALNEAVCQALVEQYRAHPSWSVQLHYDNVKSQIKRQQLQESLPSYTSVFRYMRKQGWQQQSKRQGPRSPGAQKAAKRLEQREVRSFEVDYVNGLWHLDFHHGSLAVLSSKGEWVKPILLAIMDDRSRLVCHLQWYYQETTENLVQGFCQALQKRALPRRLLTDNGSAMISGEFTRGLFALGIDHKKTLPYSPYQNGKQETFWANVEGRLLAMLENEEQLSLRQLNHATQVWVEGDYHERVHAELGGQTPLSCYCQHNDNAGRECPDTMTLQQAFTRQVSRKQRRSDGTISLHGKRFEVPSHHQHLTYVTIRYAQWDLSRISLIDAQTGKRLSTLYPQDKSKNADMHRKIRQQELPLDVPLNKPAPYLEQLMEAFAATALPSPYIPKDELGEGL